jgi:hypothetical protein
MSRFTPAPPAGSKLDAQTFFSHMMYMDVSTNKRTDVFQKQMLQIEEKSHFLGPCCFTGCI